MSKICCFKTDLYQTLDFPKYVAATYGKSANLISTGEHLFDWKVQLEDGTKSGLDIEKVVSFQYGAGYIAIRTGVTKNDWKAVRIRDLENYYILPVIVLAEDVYRDISQVQTALSNVKSLMKYVQSWYFAQVEKTYSMLAPIVILSEKDSAAWKKISESTKEDAKRWDLLHNLEQEFSASNMPIDKNKDKNKIRVVLMPNIINGGDISHGACESAYVIMTPRQTSQSMPEYGLPLNEDQSDSGYALAHEIGHAFGLDDIKSEPPNPDASVMQGVKMPNATLLKFEIDALKKSPYFSAVES